MPKHEVFQSRLSSQGRTWLTAAPTDADAVAFIGCIYLLIIDWLEVLHTGIMRGVLMLLLVALLPAGRYLAQPQRWMFLVPAFLAALEAVRSLPEIYQMHVMHGIASAMIACFTLTFTVDPSAHVPGLTGKRARWFCVVAVLAACVASAVFHPKVFDIADASVDAVKAILSGVNPYAVDLDWWAKANTGGDPRFLGYKYTPLMAIVYLPFVALAGSVGILICNAIVLGLTVIAVAALCRRMDGPPSLAVALLLANSFFGQSVLVYRVNDLLPVLPICAAFLIWPRRAKLAGLLLGASMSMKILPAPIAFALLLPPSLPAALSYIAGAAAGLIPVMVFASIDPTAFFNNVVLFQFVRPALPSSWLQDVQVAEIRLLRIIFVVTFVATAAVALIRHWPIYHRMVAYVLLTISLLLTSQINQDYYWMWWIPIFLPLLLQPKDALCRRGG